MAKTKAPKDGDPYAKFASDPNVILEEADPAKVAEVAAMMTEKARTNAALLDAAEPMVDVKPDDTPVDLPGEHEKEWIPKPFAANPWLLPEAKPKPDADPLLVKSLAQFERLVVGGLINAFASGAIHECRLLIAELRERVCEPSPVQPVAS